MKKIKFIYILSVVLSFSMMGTAAASEFDFRTDTLGQTGDAAYTSVGMAVDGINVDITAQRIINDGAGNISSMSQITGSGLGVYLRNANDLGVLSKAGEYSGIDGGNCGSSCGTSSDPDEGLLFTFDTMVSLDFLDLDYFKGDDDFNLTVDGVLIFADYNINDGPLANVSVLNPANSTNQFVFSNVIGKDFLIWADSNNDGFRVDSLRVSAVPETTPVILLIIGLIGLSLTRRKI